MKEVICKCGTIHMGVSKAYILEELKRGLEHYYSLPEAKREYYTKPDLKSYRFCRNCGSPHTECKELNDDTSILGITLNPILWDEV